MCEDCDSRLASYRQTLTKNYDEIVRPVEESLRKAKQKYDEVFKTVFQDAVNAYALCKDRKEVE